MRLIESHKVNGLNDALRIEVLDEPGDGGACHKYRLGPEDESNGTIEPVELHFQNGPIHKAGFNGISQEALLAVVRDRLIGFQGGEFACRENALALTKIEEAIHWLHHRTNDRVKRGVEGTHGK